MNLGIVAVIIIVVISIIAYGHNNNWNLDKSEFTEEEWEYGKE